MERLRLYSFPKWFVNLIKNNLLSHMTTFVSGSPIIQDNMIAGAITHVFVKDPTYGYGIFIDSMLAETEKIK